MALRLVAICALIMANAVAGLAIPEEDLWAEDPAPPMATVLPPTGDTSYAPCSSLVLEARRMSEPKVKGEKCTKLSVCRAMAIMDQTAYNTKVEASNSELAKCGKKGHPAGGGRRASSHLPGQLRLTVQVRADLGS